MGGSEEPYNTQCEAETTWEGRVKVWERKLRAGLGLQCYLVSL